ncbi:MAG TPA: M24 family metallopeptidase [Actinomycetota bacterium]|nr:M24 family metallopeptidase [Actinomycetota bacterium]
MDRVEEVETKLEKVRSWLAESGLSGVVLGSQTNFAWITAGGHNHVATSAEAGVGSAVVTADRATVVTPNIEARRLFDEELPHGCFDVVDFPWHLPEQQNEIIDGLTGGSRVAGDLPAGKREAASGVVELRRVLLPPEVVRYRELAQDAASIVESACRSIELRESELDMASRVAALCFEKNILPVVNLVAADERLPMYRHPVPTANRVDHTMLVALTARRHGLHASVTRTLCFGKPGADQVARHLAAARVDARFIQASRPGATLAEVFNTGIEQYAAEGFPEEWKLHHQGGLTGYAGREVKGTPSSGYVLQAGQVVAWNPTITGAKSEDTVLIADDGYEVLTSTGHWPMLQVTLGEATIARPDLLIR